MRPNKKNYFTIMLLCMLVVSCSKSDYVPNKENEHEEITSLKLVFTDKDNKHSESYTYATKEGQTKEQIPEIRLPVGEYHVEVFLSNRAGVDMTSVIYDKAKEVHFTYYQKFGKNIPTILYADDDVKDSRDFTIGKKTIWTLIEGESKVKVILFHEPGSKDPTKPPFAIGNIIDIEATFKLTIIK